MDPADPRIAGVRTAQLSSSTMTTIVTTTTLLMLPLLSGVSGHGRLIKPPSRSSMWRDRFPEGSRRFPEAPEDYDDSGVFCGGFARQWDDINYGKCGLCGDAWDGVRRREAPNGYYFTGRIVEQYSQGQTIDVEIDLTANHFGEDPTTRSTFTFKLCEAPKPFEDPSQDCMDRHVLGTFVVPRRGVDKTFKMKLHLPKEMKCERCVLQWTYRTGNNWDIKRNFTGLDMDPCWKNGIDEGLGCGKQEHFRACADICIGDTCQTDIVDPPNVDPGPDPDKNLTCVSVPDRPDVTDSWCQVNCQAGNCPETHCNCTEQGQDSSVKSGGYCGCSDCLDVNGMTYYAALGPDDGRCGDGCPMVREGYPEICVCSKPINVANATTGYSRGCACRPTPSFAHYTWMAAWCQKVCTIDDPVLCPPANCICI